MSTSNPPMHGPGSMVQRQPPAERLGGLLTVLDEITAEAQGALLSTPIPDAPELELRFRFEAAILNRACNALRASKLLCEQTHWEIAFAAVRQLFELLVNFEEASRRGANEAIPVFVRFGLLQRLLAEKASLVYARDTKRPFDGHRLTRIERVLSGDFQDFRVTDAKGKSSWAKSWTRMGTGDLASRSPVKLRGRQYELLYPAWSEQAHGTPGALVDEILGTNEDPDRRDLSEEVHVAETLTMALTLFIELRARLEILPSASPAKLAEWTQAMQREAERLGPNPPRH